MVVVKSVDNRWVKRYRLCFLLGIVILIFQIYLAVKFFALNIDTGQSDFKSSHRVSSSLGSDIENSVNYARKLKDGLFDDEDIGNSIAKARKKGVEKAYQSSNSKQYVINHTRLRVEELDFTPPCDIRTKEAISAIHRAKTQKCKQEISNTTCLIQKGMLYPTSLPNYCPKEGFERGKSLGCFRDEKNYRLLNGYYGNHKNNNSPEHCIRLCLQSGFPFAGVQYSTECFCGNDEPPSTAKLPDSSCNMKCPSDPHQACGGYYTVNIYQTGINKFTPQIAATAITNKEKSVKVVFLLTLNGRALRQVKRLIKILFHKDHYFYIHVDIRQDYLFRELLHLEKQFPNIRLTRNRFATIWGGASLLEMLLSCMKELLGLNWKWDFVLNLSESDYPVKHVNKLVDFLSANINKNFVKSHGREVQRFIQKQGLDKTFVECDTHMWRTGDRQLPWGIQIDGGSDWVALSRKFVQYVAGDATDELVKGLRVIFKHTLLPAESFFHTVLRNSKFCNTYVDNNLHVTNWKRKLGCKCQYKHVVDWCGCSPNDFKPEDWQRIQNTEQRQLFFARKFEPIISQAIILQLELWLFNAETVKSVPNLNSYWHSIYNSLDLGPPVDDALLTVCESAVRLKSKFLTSNTCRVDPIKIIEISSFHINDSYTSTLISFEGNVTNIGVIKFETTLKPKTTLTLIKSSSLAPRVKYLYVSSEYDQKEQILRNFPGILGPYSEPILMYIFNSSPESSAKSSNLTFIWIDPAGRLVETNDLTLDDSYTIGHIKLVVKAPLLPGSWLVKLINKNEVVAEAKFLISPLEYLSGNLISQNQVSYIHGGSDLYKDFEGHWDKFLGSSFERESLEQLAVANARRFGLDLKEWIDSLFIKFFTVGHICIISDSRDVCGIQIQKCHETKWSSYAPDPKSHIGTINATSGSFDIW